MRTIDTHIQCRQMSSRMSNVSYSSKVSLYKRNNIITRLNCLEVEFSFVDLLAWSMASGAC